VLSVLRSHHIKSSDRTTTICACVRQNNLGPRLFTQRLVIFAVLPIIPVLVLRPIGLLRARYPKIIARNIKFHQRRRSWQLKRCTRRRLYEAHRKYLSLRLSCTLASPSNILHVSWRQGCGIDNTVVTRNVPPVQTVRPTSVHTG
jgi:hypothetical protein